MALAVKQLQQQDFNRWDAFVQTCDEATFFHLSGWLTVADQACGHRQHSLYAELDGNIVAILPLVEVKSLFFGHALVSTPFCVYGGVASLQADASAVLLQAAADKAEQLNVDYLELRHTEAKTDGWPSKSTHATFIKPLGTHDENMQAMNRKQRPVVRKSIKSGHSASQDPDIDSFYTIYSTSVRNLGTPVFSKKFFRCLMHEFGDDCELSTVRHAGNATSSLMTFYFKDQVLPYYGGGVPEARNLKSMDYMYWDLMCRAVDRGIKWFDFGRSKLESGPYHYKRHWGFEPRPLCYEYHLVKATSLPNLSPNNPKYRLVIDTWKKLPLAVSQRIGPFLSKHLG